MSPSSIGSGSNHFLSLCFRDKNLEYLAWSHSLPILVWGSATTWLPNSSLDGNNFQVSKDFLTAQLQGLCLAFSHHHHLCSTLRGQPVSGLTLSPYNVTFPVPSLDSVSPQVFLWTQGSFLASTAHLRLRIPQSTAIHLFPPSVKSVHLDDIHHFPLTFSQSEVIS